MGLAEYVRIKRDEWITLLMISLILAFLFRLSFERFAQSSADFFSVFFSFFLFLFIVFALRVLVMKWFAYHNAFELSIGHLYWDQFGPKPWHRFSIKMKENARFKGIPVVIVSLFIYMLSFGMIVYSNLWKFSVKQIPHMFIGKKQKFETENPFLFLKDISKYRLTKVLFWGFMYYAVLLLGIKVLFEGQVLYSWFVGMVVWIAFISLLPFPGTEGFELWAYYNFAWLSVVVILFLEAIALFVFDSLFLLVLVVALSSVMMFFVLFYKKVLKT